MANATIRIITDTEAVILSKGANEALNGRLAYASDKKKLYVGNGTKFVVATDTDVAIDEAKDYTDTAIDEFGDQVYSKEVIDNKIDPIVEDIDAIEEEITNIHDDIGNLYTNDQIDGMLDVKADKADTYTKTEVEGFLNDKANVSDVYTKTETDTELGKKSPKLYAHWISWRVDGSHKFAFEAPILSSKDSLTTTEVFQEIQRCIGHSNETFHKFPVSPAWLWTGITATVPLGGYVSIGGTLSTANIELNLLFWNGSAVEKYTYNMGTVAAPNGGIYNQNKVLLT